jgi:alcohol dehydrogenase (cytochrome c)
MRYQRFIAGCLLAGLAACAVKSPPAATTSAEVTFSELKAARTSSEWLTYGHDYDNQRYASLDEINTRNVSKLVPVYVFQTGVAEPFETSPIVSNGMIYLTAAGDRVFAVDARRGSLVWQYSPHIEHKMKLCCGPVNRGVAIGDGLVFVGQLDDRLVALDEHTGRVVWSTAIANESDGYSITMAPLVYGNTVIVGVAGGEFAIRGFIAAYSITDGHEVWRWYSTDPQHWAGNFVSTTADGSPLHRDIAKERSSYSRFSDAWKRGGGAIWMTPAADPVRNTIYFTTGNPWPDYSDARRPGDNLYTDSIVALNASTGKLRWYFQEVPHDLWDWDAASPAVLFDTKDAAGHPRAAIGEAGKTGWFYVLDRDTGALIRRSDNFVPQLNMFQEPTPRGIDVLPGAGGGSNWSPVSMNPTLGIAVVTAIHNPVRFYTGGTKKGEDADEGAGETGSLGSRSERIEGSRRYGLVSGIDVNTGNLVWQDRFGEPFIGGSVSTGGGVTFFGESNGNFDAVDTKSGTLLWQFQTGAGVNAPPIVFSLDGHEFVAVASGGNNRVRSRIGDSLFVYALSGERP